MGARNLSDLGELERLGVDTAAPDAADTVKLVKYLWEQGADRDELREAVRTGTLGPLGLELALRAPGDAVPFQEAARRAGLDTNEAAALWRALGFPDPLRSPIALTPAQEVLVSKSVADHASAWSTFEAIQAPHLKGYGQDVGVFRLPA